MAGTNLGTAWIQIKPSMKGMTSSIRSELAGVGEAEGQNVGSKFSSGFAAKIGIITGLTQQVFSKITNTISTQMSDAISRYDTLERFPKVMEQMGYSTEAASEAIQKLMEGVEEVPTPLDQVVAGTQRLVAVTHDVNQASDWIMAISNAMLSNGASASRAADATEQFMQVVQRGKPMGQDWLTIMEVAPGVMEELAHSLGYTNASLGGDMYTALQKGILSMDDFMAALVKMDQQGTESFGALSEVAKTSTGGIETTITTLKQTISNLIRTAFEGGDITPHIESITQKVNSIAPILIKGFTMGFLGVAQALPSMIAPIIQGIVDLLPSFLQGIVELFNSIVAALPEIITVLIDAIPVLVDSLVTALTSPDELTVILQGFLTLMMASLQAFPTLLTSLINALPTIIENIVEFLTRPETIGMVIEGAVQLFMGIVTAIPQIIGAIFEAFGKLFSDLWNFLKEKFGDFVAGFGEFLGNIFKNAINGIITFVENFLNGPIDLINGFLDIINNAFGWLGVNIGKIPRISLPRLYKGGIVQGIGTDTSDSNLYALSKGEFVVRAAAAREIGYDNLERMNSTGEMANTSMVNITINGYNKDPEELANIISRKIAFNQRGVMG